MFELRVMRCVFWGACVALWRSGDRAVLYKAVGSEGSNFTGVSYECGIFYRLRPLRPADPWSRGILPSVYVSVCVIRCSSNPLYLQ
jgi:hypothetical protein